jgi:hypothetical protein
MAQNPLDIVQHVAPGVKCLSGTLLGVIYNFHVPFRRYSQNCEKRLSASVEQLGFHWTDFCETRVH